MLLDFVIQTQLLCYFKFELLIFLNHSYHPMGYYGQPSPRVFKTGLIIIDLWVSVSLFDLSNGYLELIVLIVGDIIYGCALEFFIQHNLYIRLNALTVDALA